TVAAAVVMTGMAFPVAAWSAGKTSKVTVTVRTKHDRGEVRCALHTRSDWMKDTPKGTQAPPKGKRAVCVFERIPSGTWAVAVHHDEDGDGEMPTNMMGIPKEGWGVSRNAGIGMFGGPSFEDAKFNVSNEPVSLDINVRY
ncbi:MAG: DUF2141 domain-containing protein, partial [Myxococcota bacterium]